MDSTSADPQHKTDPMGPGHLPVEILLEIASDLALEDFLPCAQVSRQWHAAWTQPPVVAALCRRFFPTLPKPHTFAAFQRACRKFFRRRHGKHTAIVDHSWNDLKAGLPCHFELDPKLHPDGQYPDLESDEPFIMAYGEGNIVWNDGMWLIFIDNLYTRKRKVLRGADWGFTTFRTFPRMCAVGKSLLVTEVGPATGYQPDGGFDIFFYHLGTNVGVKHVFKKSREYNLDDWLSIRTWGEKAFIATGPSSIHVFSHDGASLSVTHVIDPYGSMPAELHGFVRTDNSPPSNQYLPNFLPNPYDPDGVFIVLAGSILKSEPDSILAGSILKSEPDSILAGSILKSEPDSTHFLVREFSGATHIATYTYNVSKTIRSVIESVLGRNSEFIESELEEVRLRVGEENGDWPEKDQWPGTYGSDEGIHEVFRFVFRAHEAALPGEGPRMDWELHHQVSVTFSTTTKQWGVQRAFIDDGGDIIGDGIDEWIPRASMLRNQQLLRIFYDSYEYTDSRPVVTTRDVDTGGWERTRRALGKRDDLYPLNHENKIWSHRSERNIHMDLGHDEDFTVLWDMLQGEYVVFDFREPEE